MSMALPTCLVCAQALTEIWVFDFSKSAQSDQSFRSPHEESLDPYYPLSAQRRLWADWADSQTDLSRRWAHMPHCWFCHASIFDCGTPLRNLDMGTVDILHWLTCLSAFSCVFLYSEKWEVAKHLYNLLNWYYILWHNILAGTGKRKYILKDFKNAQFSTVNIS